MLTFINEFNNFPQKNNEEKSSVKSTRWCSLSLKQQTSFLVQLWVLVLQVWGLRVTGILVTHCKWLSGKAQSDPQGLQCFREWSDYSSQRGPFGINQDNYLKLSTQKHVFCKGLGGAVGMWFLSDTVAGSNQPPWFSQWVLGKSEMWLHLKTKT